MLKQTDDGTPDDGTPTDVPDGIPHGTLILLKMSVWSYPGVLVCTVKKPDTRPVCTKALATHSIFLAFFSQKRYMYKDIRICTTRTVYLYKI